MKDYGPEIREQATALVSRSLKWLTDQAVERLSGRNADARQIIYAAGEIFVFAQRSGLLAPNYILDQNYMDDLLRQALVQAEWTPKKYGRLPKSTRAAVEAAITLLTWRDLPPPEPDSGVEAAGERQDEDVVSDLGSAEDGAAPAAMSLELEPASCRPGVVYEIRIGRGETWHLATVSSDLKRWRTHPGLAWLAYRSSVARARLSEAEIDASVASVLRQYGYNVRALGCTSAKDWVVTDIARETSRLVSPDADGERVPEWQHVHDAIRRRFDRYVIHVDDSEPLPDGECEVWIKGWSGWVPACLEREGRTWKLPIGRVKAEGIEDTVAAVRPKAA